MTYDASEKSRYQGHPVECYRFSWPDNEWLGTSADRPISLPVGDFPVETITRSAPNFNEEDSGQILEVTVPRIHPVAGHFIGSLPSFAIGVQLFRAHRGGEADYVNAFTGTVVSSRSEGSQAVLRCVTPKSKLRRTFPTIRFQTACNHVLYSTPCGANPNTSQDVIIVTTANGDTVVSSDFSVRPDGWYDGGMLQGPTGEKRFIAEHIGDTVTLLGAMPGLQSLDECLAFWGCDHTEATCAAKFNNVVNFYGFPRIPPNPYESGVE